jgi:tetratricopeptide (TPR) repeat protein
MMNRSIAFAAILGALVAVLALCAFSPSVRQNLVAAWPGASDRRAETTTAIEPWPICTTMASVGDNADWAQLDPDFAAGKRALGAGDWNAAIAALKLAALREPDGADIQNYIGYAYRRLRQLEAAIAHYRQALILNPRHRSAHEHLGEAYLVEGNLAQAEEHLAALEAICLIPCDEYGDLERAIAVYKMSVMRLAPQRTTESLGRTLQP